MYEKLFYTIRRFFKLRRFFIIFARDHARTPSPTTTTRDSFESSVIKKIEYNKLTVSNYADEFRHRIIIMLQLPAVSKKKTESLYLRQI